MPRRRLRPPAIAAALTAGLALAALFLPLPLGAALPAAREVVVDGRMFAFEPGRVRVGRGDRVTLVLRSADVVHGLYVDGYGLDLVAEPGKPARATFVADRPGKFTLRCSVTCGTLHPFMVGELVVGPNWPFWRAVAALGIVAGGSLVALVLRDAVHDEARSEVGR
jgi:plastocyanin